jgi:hypothetical protein
MGTISADKLYYLWFDKQNNKHDFTGPQAGGKTATAAYPAPTQRGLVSLWGTQLQFATVGSTVCLVIPSSPQHCAASLASLSDERLSVLREQNDLMVKGNSNSSFITVFKAYGDYWTGILQVGKSTNVSGQNREIGRAFDAFANRYKYIYSSSVKKQIEDDIFTPYLAYFSKQSIPSNECYVATDGVFDCMTAMYVVRGMYSFIKLANENRLQTSYDIPSYTTLTRAIIARIIDRYGKAVENYPDIITNYNGAMQIMANIGEDVYLGGNAQSLLTTYHAKMKEIMFTFPSWQWNKDLHIAQNNKADSFLCRNQLAFGSWPHNPPRNYPDRDEYCTKLTTENDKSQVWNQRLGYHYLIVEGLTNWVALLRKTGLYPDDRAFIEDVLPSTISWIYQISRDDGCVYNNWPLTTCTYTYNGNTYTICPLANQGKCGEIRGYALHALSLAFLGMNSVEANFPYFTSYPLDAHGNIISQPNLSLSQVVTRMRKIWEEVKKQPGNDKYHFFVGSNMLTELSFQKNIHIYSPSYAPPTGHLPLFTPTPTSKITSTPTVTPKITPTEVPSSAPTPVPTVPGGFGGLLPPQLVDEKNTPTPLSLANNNTSAIIPEPEMTDEFPETTSQIEEITPETTLPENLEVSSGPTPKPKNNIFLLLFGISSVCVIGGATAYILQKKGIIHLPFFTKHEEQTIPPQPPIEQTQEMNPPITDQSQPPVTQDNLSSKP